MSQRDDARCHQDPVAPTPLALTVYGLTEPTQIGATRATIHGEH
jgi:hypothetical protein